MTKTKQMQYLIRQWKEETGNVEIDMHQVAEYAVSKGWPAPPPLSSIERLTKEFCQAAREETLQDGQTGRPYRRYHSYTPDGVGNQGVFRWIDIDEAPRNVMHKSARQRREQVVGDMVQLYLDLDHWNRVNSDKEPIVLVTDVTEDINERLSGPGEAAA